MREEKNGASVCFIGIDGSGKTVHALALCRELSVKGINCVYVRPRYALLRFVPSVFKRWINKHQNWSPRNIMVASKMRAHVKTDKDGRWREILIGPLVLSFLAYAFLTYFLSIRPLCRKYLVVCDRYFFDWFHNLCINSSVALARLIPEPDLIFLLDVPVDVAFSRMRYLQDRDIPPEYYKSLRDWYLVLAKNGGFFVIDSTSELKKTRDLILSSTLNFLAGA